MTAWDDLLEILTGFALFATVYVWACLMALAF